MKLELKDVNIFLTPKSAEYRWLRHLDIKCSDKQLDTNFDKWIVKTKSGDPIAYVGCYMDSEASQLEILEFGHLLNLNPMILEKALYVIGTGSVYGEEETLVTIHGKDKGYKSIIKKAGFERVDPEEPWKPFGYEYYIFDEETRRARHK